MIRFFRDEKFDGFSGASFDDEGSLDDFVGNVIGSYDSDACIRFLDNGENFFVKRIA